MFLPPRSLLFKPGLSIVVLVVCSLMDGRAQAELASNPLQPGNPIERSISKDETHSYTLSLAAGQYAHIVVDQRGIDLVVTVYRPDGAKIAQIDSPNFNYGFEPVSLVADSSGSYRVEVKAQARYKTTGRYQLKLEQLRSATEQDRTRVAAQKLCVEAKALRNKRTKESYQQAIENYQAALKLWRTVNDNLREAFTLHEMGWLYGDLGHYQKALDTYAQASTLYKTMGIRRGEASMLSNTAYIFGELGDAQKSLETYNQVAEAYQTIGDVDPVLISNIGTSYSKLGQYQRALDIHLRVLEMRRAVGDSAGEAITLNNIANCYDRLGQKPKGARFLQTGARAHASKRRRLLHGYYSP